MKKRPLVMMGTALNVMLACVCLGGLGCGATPEQHAADTNTAFQSYLKAVFTAQVINPDAPVDGNPVEGYPGDIGEKVYRKYRDEFGQEQSKPETGGVLLGDPVSKQ